VTEYKYVICKGNVQEKLDQFSGQGWTVHTMTHRKSYDGTGPIGVWDILFERTENKALNFRTPAYDFDQESS
jgi:hypothetical protein